MKQITLNILESKFDTFLEFIKTLDYVKVEVDQDKVLEQLQESLNQVKLIKQGKLQKQSVAEFLDEL